MNRVIKFRVWTGLSMEYNVVAGKDGAFYALIDKNDSACLAPTSKYHPDTPVMQFTGLYDKNGKEIYEGDLVNGEYDFGFAGFQTITISVKWDVEWGNQWKHFNLDTVEVVGHIFQSGGKIKKK